MSDGCYECGWPSDTHNATCSISIRARNAELLRLRAELARLTGALKEYGCHRDPCSIGPDRPCNCGLHAALSSSPAGDEVVVKRGLLERVASRACDHCNPTMRELRAILGKE